MRSDSGFKFGLVAAPLVCVGAAVGMFAYQMQSAVGGAPTAVADAVQTDVTTAATAFLALLSEKEAAQATAPYDDARRKDWHFIPKPERKGLQVKHMSETQKAAAKALLRAALSQTGYDKATTIMTLEAILREQEKDKKGGNIRDPERYYFTIFGKPAAAGTWGLSIEGHHLSLNFVVKDGKPFAHTPAFFGANPDVVKADFPFGPKKGDQVLHAEEQLAFDLFKSFDSEQKAKALIAEKAPADIRGPADVAPPKAEKKGLAASAFQPAQQALLQKLIHTYTGNMPKETAQREWKRLEAAGWNDVYFAWAGASEPGIGHYYRVEGPTFLLEFVNVQADAAGNPANHIHSVWRDPAGDFGIRVDTPHE